MYSTASTAPPSSATRSISAREPATSSPTRPSITLEPSNTSGILEQVGLVGEDLLEAQRPLLVPGPREPQRFVPRRELNGAGAGATGERHGERLERDPVDVVLRLHLGKPQGVDLDPVAEAAELLVLDAVALATELIPQRGHRAQLCVLLDEADAGIHEERDPAEHAAHEALLDTLANGVEHRDRVAHRVSDLLDGRGPRLLEVVGADVDRVPARHVLDRVRDRVGDQPHARAGWERVGAPRQILLEDVVLGRALELILRDAVILRGDDVEREQPRRGRVDRHRGVHLLQRDPVHQRPHVALVRDRDPDLADLAPRELVVGVVAGLGG